MPAPEIEELGRLLVQHVRDAAIRNCDASLRANANSPVARRWREAGAAAISVAIPDVVDEVVFCLLQAIDQGAISLELTASSGRKVDLTEDGFGELSGSYMGSGGWRAQYSRERVVDDFADLAE
jgi:hypothetical protein